MHSSFNNQLFAAACWYHLSRCSLFWCKGTEKLWDLQGNWWGWSKPNLQLVQRQRVILARSQSVGIALTHSVPCVLRSILRYLHCLHWAWVSAGYRPTCLHWHQHWQQHFSSITHQLTSISGPLTKITHWVNSVSGLLMKITQWVTDKFSRELGKKWLRNKICWKIFQCRYQCYLQCRVTGS